MLSLTATELPRFMACNGFRLLGGKTPSKEVNTDKEEGIAAHWLIEQVFNKVVQTKEELIDRKSPNGIYITQEMCDFCEEYIEFISGKGLVEADTSYSFAGVYEVRGRADHVDMSSDSIEVDDFKYGWKIVSPEENWTLISHAYGVMLSNPSFKPKQIILRIFQPRAYHPEGSVREQVYSYPDFMVLVEKLLNTLSNPSDELCTSEHCYKCPHMSQCPAAQMALCNAIDVAEMAYDNAVTNKALSYLMKQSERALKVIKQNLEAYEELALARVTQGQIVEGYQAINDLGNTAWKQCLTHNVLLLLTGKDLRSDKLITPAQAEKLGVDVSSLTERPNKGTKLTKVDGNKRAEKLFGKKG